MELLKSIIILIIGFLVINWIVGLIVKPILDPKSSKDRTKKSIENVAVDFPDVKESRHVDDIMRQARAGAPPESEHEPPPKQSGTSTDINDFF